MPLRGLAGAGRSIPHGAVRHFDNTCESDARALAIVTLGILGPDLFPEVGAILDAAAVGPPDFAALGEVMRRHALTPAPGDLPVPRKDSYLALFIVPLGPTGPRVRARLGRAVPGGASPGEERIFAAELIAALSLATDLAMGFDFEHGLRSTLVASHLAERLGVGRETAAQTYHACLLQQVGVTADLHVRAAILGDTQAAVKNHLMPVWYGEPPRKLVALARAVAPDAPPWVRAVEITRKVPRAVRVMPQVDVACREVCPMYVESFRLPAAVAALFEYIDERWDGKGALGAKGEEIPLAMRIAHVARDIDVQRVLGGAELAARVVGDRARQGLRSGHRRPLRGRGEGDAGRRRRGVGVGPDARL